ncbi:MAG TPA: OmpA family protein [Vicinamibacterales bacterium]|jgi:outer membrane protein OmpA-like peptidoglycan-associated protein
MRVACLLVVVASAWLGGSEGAPDDRAGHVPLEKGLIFTTTSRAGLTSTTVATPVADTETVYSVATIDTEQVGFRFTVSAPNDAKAAKLLDGQPVSLTRSVRREDLRSAARLSILVSSTDPALVPGQTFAGTSSAVLQALHDSGRAGFVLGVNEPEEGLSALARLAGARLTDTESGAAFVASSVSALLTSMSVSRRYYRGTLERVGLEQFPVLLDGQRTTVPALHVSGELKFTDRTIAPQIWWLDAADNPLTLKWSVAGVYETVTRIDRPLDGALRPTEGIADALTGKKCRAELSGVYFTTASAQVLDPSTPALERFAALMRQHADWHVTVEGHTDNIGSASYNLDLSARRAAAVRDVLVGRLNVAPDRLQAKGYGLTRPVETNATDEGRAHNRRVEVSRPCAQ